MNQIGLIGDIPFERQQSKPRMGASSPSHMSEWTRMIILAVLLVTVLAFSGAQGVISQKTDDHKATSLGPPPPFILYGYAYDGTSNPLMSVDITITNINTSENHETVSDGNGYYQFNLANLPSGYSLGNTISIAGNTTVYFGQNTTTVAGSGGMWFNVTLDVLIPEFSTLAAPIGGIIVIMLLAPVVGRKTSRKRE